MSNNRMSISSDSECTAPAPLCPSLPQQINPDIREEEAEGQPTPGAPVRSPVEEREPEGGSDGRVDGGEKQGDGDAPSGASVPQGAGEAAEAAEAAGAALIKYDSVKYTLVVDEHAQLELGILKDCWHGYNEHNDDSDTETVYQSANEEEDPDFEEDSKRGGGAKHKGMRGKKIFRSDFLLYRRRHPCLQCY